MIAISIMETEYNANHYNKIMSTEYIWYKNGKEVKRTADPEGKIITRKITGCDTFIFYMYHTNGTVWCEAYYKNGKAHRDGDKPAQIWYNRAGETNYEAYYKNGVEYKPEKTRNKIMKEYVRRKKKEKK